MHRLSQKRLLVIAGIIAVAGVVALGVGLGLALTPRDVTCIDGTTKAPETSTPSAQTGITPSVSIMGGPYKYAAVAPDAGICSQIGSDIMVMQRGSAVDGAIAALLCLGVTSFHSTGIGGGFFMTVYNRSSSMAEAILARETAPKAAFRDMYLQVNKSSTLGGYAVGVPGEIRGMWEAHQLFGQLPWKELFQPTIKLCQEGIPITDALTVGLQGSIDHFATFTALGDLLTNSATNEYFKEGELIRRPKLAITLTRIADEGVDAFYNGSLTADIVADIQDAGGIITAEDLAEYTAPRKDILQIDIGGGATAYSSPPPSSGAVYLYILNILQGYGFDTTSISTPEKAVITFHRIIEAFKFAYAKRTELGDDAFIDIAQQIINMTSLEFGESIRSKITEEAHPTEYYGATWYNPDDAGTSHLSVIAPNGDAVSVTSTINLWFGSKVYGSRTGIIFNNEMDDFSTPNTTNFFGVPASPANFIEPGKRPLSSMCPAVIVSSNGDVQLVAGASGGTKITTGTALVTMFSLWFNKTIKEAIDYPRIHHQLAPPYVTTQIGFPEVYIDELKKRGHEFDMVENAGSVVQGIHQPTKGKIYANSDYRKGGWPAGY